VPLRQKEVSKMFNGMQLNVTLDTSEGTTASADRTDPASYALDLSVRVRIPKPHKNLEELAKLNEQLPAALPGLPVLLDTAKVSPFFDDLYRLKVANLRTNLMRLDLLVSRHNFYDTETVLELEHPVSKRRALLVQSDMDTDMDGSDSDRVPEIDGSSATFQPMTSYRWPKTSKTQNSFIPPREARMKQIEQELATGTVTAARQQELKATQARLKMEIDDLQRHSFLVARADPFIVLPGSMFGKSKGPFAPSVGDYCVVIHGSKIYPAIVGDVGPSYKSGEASLRLCKEINPRADAANRAMNDLRLTYLVFPGTTEKPFAVPNLERWRTRCDELLKDLGGYAGELFAWEDITKPKAPPAPPATTPAPAATPAPPAPSR
jgi:hypothetical protein